MAVCNMNLQKAQLILWSLLTEQEKKNHIAVYQSAVDNLSNGITENVVTHLKVINSAPAALYFEKDESLPNQPNIVGKCLHKDGNKTIVVFESRDLIELLYLYFGDNIKLQR